MIWYNSNTSPNIIRILTKSLLLSKLNYSLPFINMNIATSNQLQTTLLAPMRKILALPSSAKTIRLQIDTALPSMHTIHFTRSASMLYNPTVSTNNYAQQLAPCDIVLFGPSKQKVRHQHKLDRQLDVQPTLQRTCQQFSDALNSVSTSAVKRTWDRLRTYTPEQCTCERNNTT